MNDHLSVDQQDKIVNIIINSSVKGLSSKDIYFEILENTKQTVPVTMIDDVISNSKELIAYRRDKVQLARTLNKGDMVQNINETIMKANRLMESIEEDAGEDPNATRNVISLMATLKGLIDSGLRELNNESQVEDAKSDSIRLCDLKKYLEENPQFVQDLLEEKVILKNEK